MEELDISQELAELDVSAIIISTPANYEEAGRHIISLDALKKKITDYWSGPKKAAHEAHKSIVAKESEMLKPVEERRKLLTGKINVYLSEQERKRQAEQTRLDAERRAKEQAERDKLLAKAEKAEAKGNAAKAEEFLEKAGEVFIPPAIAQAEIEKTTRTEDGSITAKKDVTVTVVDMTAFLKAVSSGLIPEGCVSVNESKLKQYVKLAGLKQLAGCSIEEVVSAQFRGRRTTV